MKISKSYDAIKRDDGSLWLSLATVSLLLGLSQSQTHALVTKLGIKAEETYAGPAYSSTDVMNIREDMTRLARKHRGENK